MQLGPVLVGNHPECVHNRCFAVGALRRVFLTNNNFLKCWTSNVVSKYVFVEDSIVCGHLFLRYLITSVRMDHTDHLYLR